ncbi:MAG: NTP-binding protein [Coxiella sp. (in: Bacteria)]|nr:MAG: NTP-binding protein [Coxiella sp. (in: g-proteobacteria)]
MAIDITQQDGTLMLIGTINFATVNQWRERTEQILTAKAYRDYCIDFSQVVQADSSILTLMLCLLRLAKALGIKVLYVAVPDHVLRISELYGIKSLLPVSNREDASRNG